MDRNLHINKRTPMIRQNRERSLKPKPNPDPNDRERRPFPVRTLRVSRRQGRAERRPGKYNKVERKDKARHWYRRFVAALPAVLLAVLERS